jgi:hypothetical protein
VVEAELLTPVQTQPEVMVEVELVLMLTTHQSAVPTELQTREAEAVEVCHHQAQLEDLLEVQEL